MKFWCASANSSKQRKSMSKKPIKPNDSLSSSASYATISSIPIPKSDSGYSETSSNSSTYLYLEQILHLERTHHEILKELILKYSRPFRRFLNPDEIVGLFQNIEKICTISQSIVRQYERFLQEDSHSDLSIASIYQSMFGVMIDSYNTYISRSARAQSTLKQCEKKISDSLQVPVEWIREEIRTFLQLPLRHICTLNALFQSFVIEYSDRMDNIDWQIIENVKLLSNEANIRLQSPSYTLDSSDNLTLQSEVSPIIVLQCTDKAPWEAKRLELSDSRLLFTEINRTSRIYLSNVVRINEDSSKRELHLIVASTNSKHSRYGSIKLKNVYIRFDDQNDYVIWLECLANAIQQAKDHSWSKTNELVI